MMYSAFLSNLQFVHLFDSDQAHTSSPTSIPTNTPTMEPTEEPTMEPTSLVSVIQSALDMDCDGCENCTSLLVTLTLTKAEGTSELCCGRSWTYNSGDISECDEDDCCIEVNSYLRGVILSVDPTDAPDESEIDLFGYDVDSLFLIIALIISLFFGSIGFMGYIDAMFIRQNDVEYFLLKAPLL